MTLYVMMVHWVTQFFIFWNIWKQISGLHLSKSELLEIFGERNTYPEYSVFQPSLTFEPLREATAAQRHRRDVDSHPNVFQFRALGETLKFSLYPVTNLVSEQFSVIKRSGDGQRLLPWHFNNCTFHGTEIGYGGRSIALATCGKLRGVVKGPTGELVIEPLPEKVHKRRLKRAASPDEFIVYRRSTPLGCSHQEKVPFSKSIEEERAYLHSRTSERVSNYFPYEAKKTTLPSHDYMTFERGERFSHRESQLLHVETAVYVDRDLLHHMTTNFPSNTDTEVIQVVLAMINAVQLLYSDPSLGHRVKYVLKRLELLYTDPPGLERQNNIDKFLTNFCTWQDRKNPASDDDPYHWDHALILTGLDLYTVMRSGKINSQVVGLAPVAGMCTRTSSCTVNEGRHFESVYVVAHEIGHNLGMRHDGLQSGNSCDPSGYLMSPTLGSGKVTWSHCSRKYLDNFLGNPQSVCLEDTPRSPPPKLNHEGTLLPGERFSSDQQCSLKYGPGSIASVEQPVDEICRDLHCLRDDFTWTSHPALEGTNCGHRKWCRRGYCIGTDQPNSLPYTSGSSVSPTSVSKLNEGDGEGGPWGQWSDCHSSCLYGLNGILSSGSTGLSIANSQCLSCRKRNKYRACSAVRECSRRSKSTLQNFADDACRHQSREDRSLTGYSPRLPLKGIGRCEVQCLSSDGGTVQTRQYYPDGTACVVPTEYPSYCIEGFCTVCMKVKITVS